MTNRKGACNNPLTNQKFYRIFIVVLTKYFGYDLLAQWESTSLTGKGSGVQVPHRSLGAKPNRTLRNKGFLDKRLLHWK